MNLGRTLRNALAAALVIGAGAAPTVPARAGDPPVRDQQIENTLHDILTDAQKLGGGAVTGEALDQAVQAHRGTNSWERDVPFSVTDAFSPEFGTFAVATAPDGSAGVATRSADGGCTMSIYTGGKVTTWSIADVGKNCSGASALKGPGSTIPWVDPVPPAAPAGLVATPGDGVVRLTWTAPADNDLKSYRILVDGDVRATVPAASTAYTVTGLTNYTEYRFTVEAVDEADNVSVPSDETRATPIDLTPPAIPGPVTVTDGDGSAVLGWTAAPDDDLAGYRVYLDGKLYSDVPAGTTRLDVGGLTDYTTYLLEVSSYDLHGNESARTEPVEAHPVDLTAPAVPADVVVRDGDSVADVGWAANGEDDLAGYRVYLDGQLYAEVPAGTTGLRVAGLTNGTAYKLSVAAYDSHGNTSPRSDEVTTTPRDLTPPPVPTGLRVTGTGTTSVSIGWTAVTAPDLSYYNVYVDGLLVARTTGTGTTFTVTGLTGGRTYAVSVAAVDLAGNESGRSTDVSATTVADRTPPASPVGLALTAGDGQVTATWTANKEADLAGYRVFRDGVLVADVPAGTTTFTDTGLANGRSYRYYLAAYDTSGNVSGTSGSVYATPRDSVAPGVPTDLTGEALGPDQVKLTWGAPADKDVSYYRIYVNGVSVATSSLPSYTVKDLAPGAAYTFRVAAVDTSGNAGAPSAPVTVTTGPQQPGTIAVTGNIGRVGAATTTDDAGDIYVTGGGTNGYASTAVHRFNAATQTWETLPSLPTPRMYHLSGVDAKGRLFVFGGRRYASIAQMGQTNPYYHPQTYLTSTEMYDPATNRWTTVAPMPGNGHAAGATIVEDAQGRFTIVGGMAPNFGEVGNCCYSNSQVDNYSRFVERYDPATNVWTRPAALPEPIGHHASVVDSQGRVYVLGGSYTYLYGYTQSTVRRLDAAGTGWTTLASFPSSFGRSHLAAAIDAQDRITIAGGMYVLSWGYNYQSDIQRYTPSSNSWAQLGTMPIEASNPAVAGDRNGNVYVAGGTTWSGFSAHLLKVDAAGTITRLGYLKQPRGGADAVVTPDGSLHVLNGQTYSNGLLESTGRLWVNGSSVVDAGKTERYVPAP